VKNSSLFSRLRKFRCVLFLSGTPAPPPDFLSHYDLRPVQRFLVFNLFLALFDFPAFSNVVRKCTSVRVLTIGSEFGRTRACVSASVDVLLSLFVVLPFFPRLARRMVLSGSVFALLFLHKSIKALFFRLTNWYSFFFRAHSFS